MRVSTNDIRPAGKKEAMRSQRFLILAVNALAMMVKVARPGHESNTNTAADWESSDDVRESVDCFN